MSAAGPAARLVLDVAPVAKPRMTQRDRWAERPAVLRYRAYCDELRAKAGEAGYGVGGVLRVRFALPMPASWSRAKRTRHDGAPHRGKPDVDNLCKGLMDCLLKDDAGVWRLEAEKVWAERGAIAVWQGDGDGTGLDDRGSVGGGRVPGVGLRA
ncbi:MAG: RusA family crossover junction endodeoxyribonuclease [Chloroflexota bacterium]|nr:RusA family crossover junction endodeoxyribonuclease [Chloroflexota bacterium]